MRRFAEDAVNRIERSRNVSYTIQTTEGETLVAVDKGTHNNRTIVQVEDGRLFEAMPHTDLLAPYTDEIPFTIDADNPPAVRELTVGDKIGLGQTEGATAGHEAVWGEGTDSDGSTSGEGAADTGYMK